MGSVDALAQKSYMSLPQLLMTQVIVYRVFQLVLYQHISGVVAA